MDILLGGIYTTYRQKALLHNWEKVYDAVQFLGSITLICFFDKKIDLKEKVVFVAIKNGEHQSKGFVFVSDGLKNIAPPQKSHVSKIHNTVLEYFDAL